ncbi:molybdopterin molybdotransferase MoeA [Flavimaricola marinus]|uniref:Molybdopterin molybdenumtransferase n=1 Tax=Flavimaricola marinus TaxID=1819565 RepID=A0A238LEE3_9RHOB|nr:gephyrin-like molybdotransferase Glp [Flavimaricola marinus]SMY07962.1 Molybdopterin molybdenumtransferase [Flavimaricola marinus]
MITVAEAQARCLALAAEVSLPSEQVPLADAAGRVLSAPARATRAQPPFSASAMDGYAVAATSVAPGDSFEVVAEAAAGHAWGGALKPGQAARIFTGAPVPEGAHQVVIQEDVSRDGDRITLLPSLGNGPNIRPLGADFGMDHSLTAPRRLGPAELALLAAMNVPEATVRMRPKVALLATGDELVMPGGNPGPDQIIASNVFALKAMIEAAGGEATIMPIAPDREDALQAIMEDMRFADLAVTIGGASVGDHDLVAKVGARLGLEQSFYKIAMRPGKPLIAGQFGEGRPYLGLPGNPVSAIVCGYLFLVPMIRQMLGESDVLPAPLTARLAAPVGANGPRAHYMRARMHEGTNGREVTAFDRQDSSLLTVLSEANCLLIRPAGDAAQPAGAAVTVLPT